MTGCGNALAPGWSGWEWWGWGRARRRGPEGAGQALARLGVAVGQVLVDVILSDPVGLADAHGRQLPGVDEPVHGHVRDPQEPGHLGHREESGPCALRLRQVDSPLSAVGTVRH